MNIIEKIRAEVERQAKSIDTATGDFAEGRRMEQRHILFFLDTLQEQPVDLDDEVVRWIKEHSDVDGTYSGIEFARHFYELGRQSKEEDVIIQKARTEKQRVLVTETDGNANVFWDARSLDDVKALLLCGLDFIKKQSKEQPVCEGLEDVADTLAEEHGFVKKPNFKPAKYSWPAVRDVFIEGVIAGAKWQKEKFMKEAVEGDVFNSHLHNEDDVFVQSDYLSKEQFKPGERVKMIIIKGDEL